MIALLPPSTPTVRRRARAPVAALVALALPALFVQTAPASAAPPNVVADTPAVGALAAQVMGDLGHPVVLLSPGADAHDFQLRPSQAMALAGADILFWVGPALTPWLNRAIEGVGMRGDPVALLQADGAYLRRFDEGGAGDNGHDHGHGRDDDHREGERSAAAGALDDVDPHAWLDPHNAGVWIDAIAARLSAADPENAETYAANARAARARIAALDAELSAGLRPAQTAPLIVFHDAYGYFAEHFGLNVAGAIALGDAATPGAGRIAAIRERLIETGARCVFPEAQHDPALVRVVIEGTGARMGGALDPTGSAQPAGPDHYERLMRNLAETILACLQPEI